MIPGGKGLGHKRRRLNFYIALNENLENSSSQKKNTISIEKLKIGWKYPQVVFKSWAPEVKDWATKRGGGMNLYIALNEKKNNINKSS